MNKNGLLSIGLALLISAAAISVAQTAAGCPPAPIDFLRQQDAQAKELLAQAPEGALSSALRSRMKEHINAMFDFAELSRLALGDHWGHRTPEERAHFVATFSAIIQEQNFENFLRYYREGKIEYQSAAVEKDQASVKAQIPLTRERLDIEYLLHLVHGQWRIYDLAIDGVSTAEGNRRRYTRYIERHSYEKFIEQLDNQLARLSEPGN